jgi:hypothetical protein
MACITLLYILDYYSFRVSQEAMARHLLIRGALPVQSKKVGYRIAAP